jgi:hypothetical protein
VALGGHAGEEHVKEATERASGLSNPPLSRSQERRLVLAGAALFLISTAFPVIGSIRGNETGDKWIGIADVTLAFLVVLAGIAIAFRKPAGFESRTVASALQVYRGAASVFLVLLVLFFVLGDLIHWSILLPGLAWRAWLFAWVLPSALALWHLNAPTPSGSTGDGAVPAQ